jgi:mRNA interferase RelE/StbE
VLPPYAVEFTSRAERDFGDLDRPTRIRVRDRLVEVSHDPRCQGSKKLAGGDGLYRVRVGNHRIVYSIDDDGRRVIVARIFDRKDGYD